ncbi:Histone acetyltransferase type B catalytic subunit [Eumeta japonica]|uniref:Histone acetyltransferase type B catalytic subunit n=1 Tax=Eumeta variegata TaxID=151549 RepID=A0A4C1VK06_EUMVA|nr:Histone acetyltransferase type B catalytic subunit [Eumeta japonica]
MTDALCHLVVDGNEVLEFKLVRDIACIEDDKTSFKPEMCHQVFGENENIFGYTDLHIRLYYCAGSLQTYLGIEYTDKIEPNKSEGLKADDVEGALQKVLAPGYVTNLDRFISLLEKDKNFLPHGKLENSFTVMPRDGGDKRTFEVYYCETSTPGFLQYHKHLQTFLLWYVDAASFIDVDDDQWTFFTVSFEKYMSSEGEARWAAAGYATVYRYYAYPHHRRPRVSQVLVFPPYRKLGICANLLQTIYSHFIALPEVLDITVEDPSEDFQRIRDYVDAKNCATLPAFQPDRLIEGYTAEMAAQARSKFKINRRQARRVYEILRLRATDLADRDAYTKYRLAIKNRLNAPFQKKKLEMRKLEKVLKREEYLAALSTSGAGETQGRLAAQYHALEAEYRRVIARLELGDY